MKTRNYLNTADNDDYSHCWCVTVDIHDDEHVFRGSFDTGARQPLWTGTSVASTRRHEHTDIAKFVFSCQLLSNGIGTRNAVWNVPHHKQDDICKIPQTVVKHVTQGNSIICSVSLRLRLTDEVMCSLTLYRPVVSMCTTWPFRSTTPCFFPTKCIYGFLMFLWINSDYFLKQPLTSWSL
jgi:hypothetical protein